MTALMSQKLLQRFKHNTINSMKNLFLGLVMFVGTASFANTGDPVKELPVLPATTTKIEVVNENTENANQIEDEALRCKVSVSDGISTVTLSCWFCNCADLLIDAQLTLESIYE